MQKLSVSGRMLERRRLEKINIYTTKGTSSPILRRSEEEWDILCNMKI